MIRPMTFEEVQNHQWKTYKLDITNKTSKYDVINFVNSKAIKTDELAFGQYPVYIQPMTTTVKTENCRICQSRNNQLRQESVKL